jgi:hypothetical protein
MALADAILAAMIRVFKPFSERNHLPEGSPPTLWNDVFMIAVGFFCLGVSLFGFIVELGPRFVAGAHLDRAPLVSFALVGAIALFFIVEALLRIGRTIDKANGRRKTTSALR